MAKHDDAAAGELTEGGGVAVLDPDIEDIEDIDEVDDTDADEPAEQPAKPKSVRRLAAVIDGRRASQEELLHLAS